MKKSKLGKVASLAALAAFASFGLAPAPALADPGGVYFVQCDSQNCYMVQCATLPNVNGEGWDGHGCQVIDSWPRPREMGGD